MADLGKAIDKVYHSQKDVPWIANQFRELAPQVRNVGGWIMGGKVRWIQPASDGAFAGIDAEPDFAVNAFFPVARNFKARNEAIGYTLKLSVWDEGDCRRVMISSQASRQADRLQSSGALQKLIRMITDVDETLTPDMSG
jgi:hypothetical protein